MGTIHKYDWVQLGGAVKHPEEGKIIDIIEKGFKLGDKIIRFPKVVVGQ